jgi:hypothetical protein
MVNMKNKSYEKLAIAFALVLVGSIILYALPAEADKSRVEYETLLTVPAGTYEYGNTEIYVPASPESVSYMASFSVPSGATVKFQILDIGRFELWQEGIYEPNWVVGSEGHHGIGISSEFSKTDTLYLIVVNDASVSSQEVMVQLSRTWHESNKLGALAGSAIVSLGIGLTPLILFGKSKLHAKYSVTLFAMAIIMVLSIALAPYESYPPNPIGNILRDLPVVFFFEAFPLIALLYLLEKNNGFAYFKAWKTRTQLQISGILLFSGYTLPIWVMLFGMIALILRLPLDSTQATQLSLALGGSLMLTGSVIFIGLWTSHHQRESLNAVQNSAQQ